MSREDGTQVDYRQGDITDYKVVREIVRDQDAIIHLAAFRHPAAAAGHEIFRVNTAGTYNIFQAAVEEGIKRVACASSINALGYNFGVKSFDLQYFPIETAYKLYN
jgi:nucleoside-diphosphate-sugar epimerase